MLVINISSPTLINDEEHERTIVQVDDDPSFDDPLIDDDSDENLFRRQYDESLTPDKKYYVRARYYLDPGGYQGWSNVYTFTARDVDEVNIKMERPVLAVTPTLSIPYFDKYSTPTRDFRIDITPHDLNKSHIDSMSVIIEDMQGNTKLYLDDIKQLDTHITVPKQLAINTPYIVRAMVKTHSGSVSKFGSLLFKTYKEDNAFKVIRESIEYDNGVPIKFNLKAHITFESYDVEVIDIKYESTYNDDDIDSTSVDVSENVNDDTLFVRVRGTLNGEKTNWHYVLRT